MNDQERGLMALLAAGIGLAVFYAYNNTPGKSGYVPPKQSGILTMSMGKTLADNMTGPGNALDMDPDIHFWHPGMDPCSDNSAQPVMQSRLRYPSLPGGNISVVMHQGWSSLMEGAPADNDWRINPPEAAVL
jgi:hypothetical protein